MAGSNPSARTAGSASPPCLHNVGYGRPAPRAFAVTQPFIALSRHCEDLSLRAAFSREEQSDVAGSNLAPYATPPVTATAYGLAATASY